MRARRTGSPLRYSPITAIYFTNIRGNLYHAVWALSSGLPVPVSHSEELDVAEDISRVETVEMSVA